MPANTVMSSDLSQLGLQGFSLFRERPRQGMKGAEPTQLKSPGVTKHIDSVHINAQPGICVCLEHMVGTNQTEKLARTHAS